MAESGLAERFEAIHIVSEKDPETYSRIIESCGVSAGRVPDGGQLCPKRCPAGHPKRGQGDSRALRRDVGPRNRRRRRRFGLRSAPVPLRVGRAVVVTELALAKNWMLYCR